MAAPLAETHFLLAVSYARTQPFLSGLAMEAMVALACAHCFGEGFLA
jgi:hypothetical protein